MDLPSVLIGCPVRNRAWILPQYLQALTALDYPQDRIQYAFVLNDCTDKSREILEEFSRQWPTTLLHCDFGHPRWRRGHYSYENLAILRNLLLKEMLDTGAAYLFSVDSDILVPPFALKRLLQADRPIVAGRVPNDLHLVSQRGICNFLRYDVNVGRMVHLLNFPPDTVIPVDVTGAAVLIRRDVAAAGSCYSPGFTGEDEGFCGAAKTHGFSAWVDTGVVCSHQMVPPGRRRTR